MKFFKSISSFFGKLFKSIGQDNVFSVIEKIEPLVNFAYPVVKRVAELTENKTDDAILAAYESYGLTKLFKKGYDKNLAIRDLVKQVVKTHVKENTAQEYLLNTAVELAYASFREEKNTPKV